MWGRSEIVGGRGVAPLCCQGVGGWDHLPIRFGGVSLRDGYVPVPGSLATMAQRRLRPRKPGNGGGSPSINGPGFS